MLNAFIYRKVAKKPKKVKKVKPLSEQAAPEVDKSRYFQANQDALKEAFGQNEGEETTEKVCATNYCCYFLFYIPHFYSLTLMVELSFDK